MTLGSTKYWNRNAHEMYTQIANHLTDNAFKQVQIAYLAVISNLVNLFSLVTRHLDRWQALGLAKQRLSH